MKEINIEPIAFRELETYNDGNSFVITALKLENTQADAQELAKQLQECELCADKDVVAIRYITGNIMGEAGRHDYLIEYKADKPLNPLTRLKFAEFVKWTSDFMDNYRKDYTEVA